MRTYQWGSIKESNVWRAAQLLSPSDRKKVYLVIAIQILLGLLDLIGIALIGVLGALSIRGIEGRQAGDRVGKLLDFLQISEYQFQTQIAILGGLAGLFLIGKTICSIYFSRKIIYFLSRRGAKISSELIRKFLRQNLLQVQARSSQESLFGLTAGVEAATIGILSAVVNLVSDTTLLIILSIGLFAVDKVVALSTFIIFGSISLALYKIMHLRATKIGIERSNLTVSTNQQILEAVSTFRELVVKNRQDYYGRQVENKRLQLADLSAEFSFMPSISKYAIEICISIGALVICGTQFLLHDASRAVGILSVFLAASTRIAPAVLRLQQGAIQIKGSQGSAEMTFRLINDLKGIQIIEGAPQRLITNYEGFVPQVVVNQMTFSYLNDEIATLNEINLVIPQGKVIAIVGPSGSGKTTLVDLILGILNPIKGKVTISGLAPGETVSRWPGAVAYVPQDVLIVNGTIRENVSLGYDSDLSNDELIWDALTTASLENFVKSLPNGLDTYVGDRGTRLSGGQRQRLGIARALYTKPLLLILDEATSALDGEIEAEISETILNLKGAVTVIMIAHRLSSIRNSDQLIYLEEGRIRAIGTFAEIRAEVPNFERQAQLMGL